ncbi:MAG: hypothetical protein CVU44_14750 [Chloroflexi bacterium HGW-Chloroflexi-6]|nr:MAG: hypothetical protein CVU44_14750 [Chloroflexi bacterium HGW-Chloroflexi-6]
MSSLSKILVVNNDPVLLDATRAVLESAGYETLQASSGDETLAVAREHHPNLVLLDVNLDKLAGFEICHRIKTDQLLAGTTIIVILSSIHTDTDSRAQGLESGADDYILRPIANRELLARIRALLRGQAVERALQASEKRFRALVENSSDAITLLDAKGVAIYDSPAAPGMLGYTPQDWIGRDVFSLIHPDDLPQAQDLFQRLVKTPGTHINSTFRLHHKSGAWLWIEMVATNLLFEPDVNAVVLNYRDITEQKQNETINAARLRLARFSLTHSLNELLEETLNETEKLTDSLIGFYHFVEEDQKSLTLQNWSTRTKTEFCKAEGPGLHYAVDAAGVWVDCIRQGKAVIHNNYAALSHRKGMPEGHATIIRELVVPVFRGDKISAVLGVGNKATDYSEKDVEIVSLIANLAWEIAVRKQAEEALRESEDKFKYIFEHSVIGKSITLINGEINVNQAFCDMLGYSPEELKKRTWQEISHPADLELTQTEINNLLSNQRESTRFIKRYLHKNGSEIWAEVGSALRRDTDGKPLYFLTTINDITARKQAELAFQASNAYLQAVLDSVTDAVFVDDADTGQIIDVNQGMCAMYGYSRAEALRIPIGDLSQGELPYSQTEALEWLRKAREIEPQTFEWLAKHKDGHLFWTEVSTRFAVIGGENRFVVVVRDISERKQAENALRENQANLRALLDAILESVLLIKTDGTVITVNTTVAGRLNSTIEGMIGQNVYDFVSPDVAEFRRKYAEQVIATGQPIWFEDLRNGRFVLNSISPVLGTSGQVERLAIFGFDITERKQAEEALKLSNELLSLFIQHSPIYAFIKEVTPTESRVLKASENFEEMIGIPGSQMVGKSMQELFPPELAKTMTLDDWAVASAGQVLKLEEELNGRSYTTIKFPIQQGGKHLLAGYTIDITERRKAEEALRQSETFNRSILENSPIGISVRSQTGKLISANEAWKKIWAISEADFLADQEKERQTLNFNIRDGYLAPHLDAVQRVYQQGEHLYLPELKITKPRPGAAEWIAQHFYAIQDEQGQVQRVVILTEDITERKQAEEDIRKLNAELEQRVEARTRELQDAQEKLVRQEKLAVLGQLAGGVGHELRNPLGIINNATYYLRLVQPEADETVKEYLGIIETETHNADKIISDLLDFSRIKSVDVEPVAVSDLARRTLERFPPPQNVRVTLDLPEELPILYVDPRQLIQVLGNLVLNACQAMPQGGTLSLSAKKKGKMVALAVADTGTGIAPETMQKLFEPLFTTKPKGIGLGLAVSKKLVEANNGKIEIKSQPGQGTTFTVYLPVKP